MGKNTCNQCEYAATLASHLRKHWKTHSGEKPSKCSQCEFSSSQARDFRRYLETHSALLQCTAAVEQTKQMQPMWFCILSGGQFAKTFANAQWGKVKQIQPIWFSFLLFKFFKNTFENTHWVKAELQNVISFTQSKSFKPNFTPWQMHKSLQI